jgi:lysophospholipase L1-like esterase
MPTVLCYGDSNTHGTAPMRTLDDVQRFGPSERWAGILRATLGSESWVVEEGLPGRTTVLDDPIEGIYKNGLTALPACLESHRPIDIVTIALGTNDLKMRFSMPPTDIAAGAGILVETVRNVLRPFGEQPKILLIAPPPILETGCLADMFAGGAAKSQSFGRHYAAMAQKLGVGFLDFGAVIESSAVDGIHFDLAAHRALGEVVTKAVRSL